MPREKQTFFILGLHRSGTTLLEQMLDGHSEIGMCHEISSGRVLWRLNAEKQIGSVAKSTLILNYFFNMTKIIDDPMASCLAEFAQNKFDYPLPTEDWLHQLIDTYLTRRGAKIFGEKSPANTFFSTLIDDVFPNSKSIIIYRNPFDIILSTCEIIRIGSNKPIDNRLLLKHAAQIKRGLGDLNRKCALPSNNLIAIRYEDLVRQPVKTLRKICVLLDIEYEDEMLNFQGRKKFLGNRNIMTIIHSRLNKLLTDERIDRSFDTLTEEQIALLNSFLSPEIKELPYKFDHLTNHLDFSSKWLLFIARIKFSFRLHLFEEYKNKLRFQIHAFLIHTIPSGLIKNYLLRNLNYSNEDWSVISNSAVPTLATKRTTHH